MPVVELETWNNKSPVNPWDWDQLEDLPEFILLSDPYSIPPTGFRGIVQSIPRHITVLSTTLYYFDLVEPPPIM